MTSIRSVPYDDFTAAPGAVIDSIPMRGRIMLTHNSKPLATMQRLPARKADIDALVPDDAEPLSVTAARTGTFDRALALRAGAKFVLGRGGRREAVIAGVTPCPPDSRRPDDVGGAKRGTGGRGG